MSEKIDFKRIKSVLISAYGPTTEEVNKAIAQFDTLEAENTKLRDRLLVAESELLDTRYALAEETARLDYVIGYTNLTSCGYEEGHSLLVNLPNGNSDVAEGATSRQAIDAAREAELDKTIVKAVEEMDIPGVDIQKAEEVLSDPSFEQTRGEVESLLQPSPPPEDRGSAVRGAEKNCGSCDWLINGDCACQEAAMYGQTMSTCSCCLSWKQRIQSAFRNPSKGERDER
jgi:hypothetical protein